MLVYQEMVAGSPTTKGPIVCRASMHHDPNDQYCNEQNDCQHREAGNGCQSPDIRSLLYKCA